MNPGRRVPMIVALSCLLLAPVFGGCAVAEGEESGNTTSDIRSSAPATGTQRVGSIFKLTGDRVRLRKDPAVASGILLDLGTRVTILESQPTDTFYNVEVISTGQTGWVDGGYLIADGADVDEDTTAACTALSTCCSDLKSAGFSDTTCRKVVAKNNSATCRSTQESHAAMGDCKSPSAAAATTSACVSLSTCCSDLKRAGFSDTTCRNTVAANNSAECRATQESHASMGDCKSPTVAAGTRTSACTALSTCCADLKRAGFSDTTCRNTVAENNSTECRATHESHASMGDCTSPTRGTVTTDACSALSTCCSDLKAAGFNDATCRGVVASNNDATCRSTHASHANMGDCRAP